MSPAAVTALLVALLVSAVPAALAHTTITVEPYDIEVGWGLEPPVAEVRNTFVFHVTAPGQSEGVKTGITNAFQDLTATAHYGGISKTLEINSDPRPGYYFADVIPTRTGSISVSLEGTLRGVAVDVDVPIEDVESTALLDFPPRTSASDQSVQALEAAVTSMQADIARLQSNPAPVSGSAAYDFAVLGVSLGAVAVALAVLALVRRPS